MNLLMLLLFSSLLSKQIDEVEVRALVSEVSRGVLMHPTKALDEHERGKCRQTLKTIKMKSRFPQDWEVCLTSFSKSDGALCRKSHIGFAQNVSKNLDLILWIAYAKGCLPQTLEQLNSIKSCAWELKKKVLYDDFSKLTNDVLDRMRLLQEGKESQRSEVLR